MHQRPRGQIRRPTKQIRQGPGPAALPRPRTSQPCRHIENPREGERRRRRSANHRSGAGKAGSGPRGAETDPIPPLSPRSAGPQHAALPPRRQRCQPKKAPPPASWGPGGSRQAPPVAAGEGEQGEGALRGGGLESPPRRPGGASSSEAVSIHSLYLDA
jgi:hypothetical protein